MGTSVEFFLSLPFETFVDFEGKMKATLADLEAKRATGE